MTILWLVLDSKFALRKYFDYSHTLSDFSLNINFSIWLQLTLKPSWFIKVYNVWLFLTIADYFWLFLTFMRKFLTQNLSLAEVIFWILGGHLLPRSWLDKFQLQQMFLAFLVGKCLLVALALAVLLFSARAQASLLFSASLRPRNWKGGVLRPPESVERRLGARTHFRPWWRLKDGEGGRVLQLSDGMGGRPGCAKAPSVYLGRQGKGAPPSPSPSTSLAGPAGAPGSIFRPRRCHSVSSSRMTEEGGKWHRDWHLEGRRETVGAR